MNPTKTIIVIAGPTAVGKSDIALTLAKHYNTSILSADARQCFREMNIGTAKPPSQDLAMIKHYFINSHSIHDAMSVGKYERYALHSLEEIFRSNNIAIVVGGTGLYINAIINGIDIMPDTNTDIVKDVERMYDIHGIAYLANAIDQEDIQYASKGNMSNPARMIRALSFYRSTGQSILSYQKGKSQERPFHVIGIGIDMDRDKLYDRINTRVDRMIENGLYEEAKMLFDYRDNINLRTVGYQEFYIGDAMAESAEAISSAIIKIKQHTRNYAKRQWTWFRNKANLTWYGSEDIMVIKSHIEKNLDRKISS